MTLNTEAEYRAALAEIEPYFDGPQLDQMRARFDELLNAIEAYEREFYPIEAPLAEAWMNFPGPDPDSSP